MAQASDLVTGRAPEAAASRVSLPILRMQERRLLLAVVDAGVAAAVMLLAYQLWRLSVHPAADNMDAVPWSWVVVGALSWVTISWLAGAYELAVADRFVGAAKRTTTVGMIAAVEALAAYWLFPKTYPRPALALIIGCVPIAILMWRGLYAGALRRPASATRVLVLGHQEAYDSLTSLAENGVSYYKIVGLVGAGEGAGGIASGPIADLGEIAQRCGAHRIVVAPRVQLTAPVITALTTAIERGIEVFDFNAAYEEMAGKVAVDHAGDHWLAALPTRPKTSSFEEVAMRALDVVGSIIGLTITAILFPFIAMAILITSRGPLIYSQERLGRGGRVFTIYKFRSMAIDAEAQGARWADTNDTRVTPIGGFLRRTHLDELPQFWNILCGEMSLAGPRPERPEFTRSLSHEIPFYRLRLSVRPGLTGLKQIKVGYASTEEEHLEVLRHDLYYIKHRSLALNLAIIARTLGTVIGRDGR